MQIISEVNKSTENTLETLVYRHQHTRPTTPSHMRYNVSSCKAPAASPATHSYSINLLQSVAPRPRNSHRTTSIITNQFTATHAHVAITRTTPQRVKTAPRNAADPTRTTPPENSSQQSTFKPWLAPNSRTDESKWPAVASIHPPLHDTPCHRTITTTTAKSRRHTKPQCHWPAGTFQRTYRPRYWTKFLSARLKMTGSAWPRGPRGA
ncbi:hypothetical protein KC19_9G181300 [Ceratodon purpureus]|uniref:Uncharacterized protein n=1 Tax=Ceratodon purpureus TaxID=3225 RepID=A0A8T0H1B3_CERPU|nr:hypothetical protein KC19_9G181300 [Ceratodon purpureus]